MSDSKDPKYAFAESCQQVIGRVDMAILRHQTGEPEDLSLSVLLKVRDELLRMQAALSRSVFCPSYGRFVLDWPDEHGLVRQLSDLEYRYMRLR